VGFIHVHSLLLLHQLLAVYGTRYAAIAPMACVISCILLITQARLDHSSASKEPTALDGLQGTPYPLHKPFIRQPASQPANHSSQHLGVVLLHYRQSVLAAESTAGASVDACRQPWEPSPLLLQ